MEDEGDGRTVFDSNDPVASSVITVGDLSNLHGGTEVVTHLLRSTCLVSVKDTTCFTHCRESMSVQYWQR